MSENEWIDYWNQDEFWDGVNLWQLNAEVFLRRARPVIGWTQADVVLDIGSGPGVLARELAKEVKSVVAVDAAPRFVEMAKANFRGVPNASAETLGAEYTDLSHLNERFSLMLCISVVQYYKCVEEIEALIRSAEKVSLPGGRLLIADLNLKRGSIGFAWDAFCSFAQASLEGYAPKLAKMAWKRWITPCPYRHVGETTPLIEFSLEEIEALIRRLGLNATILKKSMSIYANRPSLLVQF